MWVKVFRIKKNKIYLRLQKYADGSNFLITESLLVCCTQLNSIIYSLKYICYSHHQIKACSQPLNTQLFTFHRSERQPACDSSLEQARRLLQARRTTLPCSELQRHNCQIFWTIVSAFFVDPKFNKVFFWGRPDHLMRASQSAGVNQTRLGEPRTTQRSWIGLAETCFRDCSGTADLAGEIFFSVRFLSIFHCVFLCIEYDGCVIPEKIQCQSTVVVRIVSKSLDYSLMSYFTLIKRPST